MLDVPLQETVPSYSVVPVTDVVGVCPGAGTVIPPTAGSEYADSPTTNWMGRDAAPAPLAVSALRENVYALPMDRLDSVKGDEVLDGESAVNGAPLSEYS